LEVLLAESDQFILRVEGIREGVKDVQSGRVGNWTGELVLCQGDVPILRDMIVAGGEKCPPVSEWRRRAVPQVRRLLWPTLHPERGQNPQERWKHLRLMADILKKDHALASVIDEWLHSLPSG